MVSISMEVEDLKRMLRCSILSNAFIHRRSNLHTIHTDVPDPMVNSSSFYYELHNRVAPNWKCKNMLSRSMQYGLVNMGSRGVLFMHFITSTLHTGIQAKIYAELHWNVHEALIKETTEGAFGSAGDHTLTCHVQILMEMSMVMLFYTNRGLFFAGNITVNIPYLLIRLQRVVLAPTAHSLGERSIVSISMKAKEENGQGDLKWIKLEFFACCTYQSLPQNVSCNCQMMDMNKRQLTFHTRRNTQEEHLMPRCTIISYDVGFWCSKRGSMSALWTKTSVHFINSISQK